MEGSQEITGLVNVLTSYELWQAVFVFIVGFVVLNIIKSIASNIFQFILFKTDVFGIGSYVEYKGKKGIIKEIGLRRILLELEGENSTMFIRTMDWKNLILIIPDELGKNKD